ncbi:NAD(P)-dependent oxidoreductase [Virgibacillus doumboii]|uniref:NAD(P)-dependent oxidoreductase n=1 Tax=Virgibacillus doumboii TaxID=2697503 RepID=UPI001FE86F9F|nr:NAD(P)-dependent oxidoreductase [Virgibacillus doumboii]
MGVVGCGLMGHGIAKNLLKNNYTVMVYDIDQTAVKRLESIGAIGASSVKMMAKEIDCLILSLPTPELVRKTLLGDGTINGMRAGTNILDMSTNDVEVTRELHNYAKEYEIDFFDCPLSGGPAGAEAGSLTIMVGGNEAAYSAILPVLNAIGDHIDFVGPSGAGQTVKLCHNMVVGGVITLLSEAFLTGEKAGVTKEKVASILQKGSAQTKVMEVFGQNILNGSFEDVKFSLANMTKDIHLYRNLAETQQIPTYVSQPVDQLYQMAKEKGRGGEDSSTIYNVLAEMGGKSFIN